MDVSGHVTYGGGVGTERGVVDKFGSVSLECVVSLEEV